VVLSNAVQPLVDALDQGQVDLERRRYAAVALAVVVMRLERVDLPRPRAADLLAATFKDPDPGVRDYAGRAMHHIQHVLKEEKRSATPAAGTSGTKAGDLPAAARNAAPRGMEKPNKLSDWRGLVAKLNDKNPAVRRQAAFALQRVVQDVKSEAEVKRFLPPLVAATLKPWEICR